MHYQARVTRQTPVCFCFLLDQSGSMEEQIAAGEQGGEQKKSFLANAVNKVLQELVLRSLRGDEVRPYFDIALIGYKDAGAESAFIGPLHGKRIVPIGELANGARVEHRRRKISDGAGGLVEENVEFPVWVDPVASGQTPMRQAFDLSTEYLTEWVQHHPDSFPPIVMNFTDGEPTEPGHDMGPVIAAASRLKAITTNDGNAVLINCHISAAGGAAIVFPNSRDALPGEAARLLFDISSPLTGGMIEAARALNYQVQEGTRGFVYQAHATEVIHLLQIGTTPMPENAERP